MISIEKEIMIRSLLASGGTTKAAISRETGISVDTILKISRLPALRKRKARKCNGCGASVEIWPCLFCHPNSGMPDYPGPTAKPRIIGATKALKENVSRLIRISQDISSLNELGIECFNNPLFRALVSRADRVLRKINVKKGEFVDVKFE